jgi:hypothetical protein
MEETEKTPSAQPGKNQDEIALDLMRFIATETGYGRGQGAVGFSGKNSKTSEEHAEALLGLFDKCRKVVKREPAG